MSGQSQALGEQLSSSDVQQARSSAEQLSLLGEEAGPAAVQLARAAGCDDEETREFVVAALEELGSPPADAVDSLIELLKDSSADTGYWAATLLGRLGEDAAAACVPLADALGNASQDLIVRERAAWALGKIGPAAASARESLAKAASSSDARLARLAAAALASIDE